MPETTPPCTHPQSSSRRRHELVQLGGGGQAGAHCPQGDHVAARLRLLTACGAAGGVPSWLSGATNEMLSRCDHQLSSVTRHQDQPLHGQSPSLHCG
jgi:hypothetical protein